MNNIFYEFLEKNKLGLSDAFDELPIYENMTITPGLPNTLPKPDEIIFYTIKFNYDKKSYRFNLNKKNKIQYMYLTGFANGENITHDEQRKILSAILTFINPRIAKTLTAKATAKPLTIALVNPKTGDDSKTYDAFSVSNIGREADVLNKHLNTFFNKKGVMLDGDESESAENQSSQEQQKSQATVTTSDSNDKKGNMGTETAQVATGFNKNKPGDSTGGKFVSSRKAAVDAAKKEIKMQEFGKNVAAAKAKRAEIVKGPKEEIFKKMNKQDFDAIQTVYDKVRKIHSNANNDNIQNAKFSLKKDMSKYRKNTNLDSELISIVRVIPKLKTIATRYNIGQGKDDPNKVNELLKLYGKVIHGRENDPSVSWFYENHVNNHFTMKRIFNS